jgi:hypothetical protein
MKVLLKPANPDRDVPDPATRKAMPAQGVKVGKPLSQYWLRRLRDGDVVMAELPTPSDSE